MKGYPEKKRGVANRSRRKRIFVIAEGRNKTEKLYFRSFFRENCCQFVSSENDASDPVRLVKHLVKDCREKGFRADWGDKAYCFIDHDMALIKDKQIIKAEQIIHNETDCKPELIVSNPCFEIWLLCHYCYSAKNYNKSSEVVNELKRYIPKYEKTNPTIFEMTKDKIQDAINNAKKLEKYNIDNGEKIHTFTFCPSTEVYKAIENM